MRRAYSRRGVAVLVAMVALSVLGAGGSNHGWVRRRTRRRVLLSSGFVPSSPRRVQRHRMRNQQALPWRAAGPQDHGGRDRSGDRQHRPGTAGRDQVPHRCGRRQLSCAVHRTHGRTCDHVRMRRRNPLLPQRQRNQRPNGRRPTPHRARVARGKRRTTRHLHRPSSRKTPFLRDPDGDRRSSAGDPVSASTGTTTARDALVALYNATNGPNWANNTRRQTGGIQCLLDGR